MAKRDYYEVLGISKDAGDDDIKRAYRKLALKYHPDKNSGDKASEEKFKEINEAYEVLKDPQKRKNYNMFGHNMHNMGSGDFGGFGGFGDFSKSGGFGDVFGDIFEDFFGGTATQTRRRSQRGSDLRYNMEVSFEEAVFGKETKIRIPRWEDCSECNGKGAKPGSGLKRCPTCNGAGQIRFQQGFFTINKTCSQCRGEGEIVTELCKKCNGQKKIKKERTISLNIPAGVDTGSQLRLVGEGELGINGGPPGDLYVVIMVKDHHLFERDGDNILLETTISFIQAALGARIKIPTIKDPVIIKIPPGTQNGRIFRLKDMGVSRLKGYGKGDQLVKIKIEIPTKLTSKQKELLQEYARISGEKLDVEGNGIFEKVKNFFDGN
ncbi:MAG: molecular chaperone DnaJ [Nitrospirota bacterium]